MKNLVVTDPVPGCFLDRVELEVEALSVSLKGSNGKEKTWRLRAFFPKMVDGKYKFLERVCEQFFAEFEQAEGAEWQECAELSLMVWLGCMLPDLDKRHVRRFDIRSLDYLAEYKRVARRQGTMWDSRIDRLKRIAGRVDEPTSELIEGTIYETPEINSPLLESEYAEFRGEILDGLVELMGWLEEKKPEALARHRRKIEADKGMSPKEKAKALATLDAIETGEIEDFMPKVTEDYARYIFKKQLDREDRFVPHFEPIVEKAKKLREPVLQELARNDMETLTEDGDALTPEFAHCVRSNFDVRTADAVLDDAVRRYEEVHKIEPVQESKDLSEGQLTKEETEDMSPEQYQYVCLVQARKSEDVLEKWHAICWITKALVSHKECLRLLCREAEAAALDVLDYGFRQVYRKVFHVMTYHERRMFRLMYFSQPIFNYRIAAPDPVISSFFDGLGEQTTGMILLVLVFKVRDWHGMSDMDKELEWRWRIFLSVYPWAVRSMQERERTAKRKRSRNIQFVSLQERIGRDKDGERLTREDQLADPRIREKNLLRLLMEAKVGTVPEWARKYCTPKQAERIIKHFCHGKTEEEIAKGEGISKQAVSESILAGLRSIGEGLLRDCGFDKDSLEEWCRDV